MELFCVRPQGRTSKFQELGWSLENAPSFLWKSDTFLLFFRLTTGGQTPKPILTQNGSNDVHSRKDVPFAVKTSNSSYPLISRAPKRSKFCKFLDKIFRSIWPLTLEVQRENTTYSSSEPNESGIVNRQSGGKLKYALKLYLGVHFWR